MNEAHVRFTADDGQANGYDLPIERFVHNMFPGVLQTDSETVLDTVINIFLGSRQVRLTPLPAPEVQVNLRSIARKHIEAGTPIPVLVPFGPHKPNDELSVDIAELAVLKRLRCLQHDVQQHYKPGLHFTVRLEDLTGLVIRGEKTNLPQRQYCRDFEGLVHCLELCSFVTVLRESSVVSEKKFLEHARAAAPKFLDSFWGDEDAKAWLGEMGWKGAIHPDTLDFIRQRQARRHGGDHRAVDASASRYFASALARRITGATMEAEGGSLHLYFAPPMPGVDWRLHGSRVYYRTVPLRASRRHLPPWRAEGYLRVNSLATPAVAHPGKLPEGTQMGCLHFKRDATEVTVRAPYLITGAPYEVDQ